MDIVLDQEFLGDEEEADLTDWLVEEGATVSEGDPIAQFETSKLVADFHSPASGVISKKMQVGAVVKAGEVFADISN